MNQEDFKDWTEVLLKHLNTMISYAEGLENRIAELEKPAPPVSNVGGDDEN